MSEDLIPLDLDLDLRLRLGLKETELRLARNRVAEDCAYRAIRHPRVDYRVPLPDDYLPRRIA